MAALTHPLRTATHMDTDSFNSSSALKGRIPKDESRQIEPEREKKKSNMFALAREDDPGFVEDSASSNDVAANKRKLVDNDADVEEEEEESPKKRAKVQQPQQQQQQHPLHPHHRRGKKKGKRFMMRMQQMHGRKRSRQQQQGNSSSGASASKAPFNSTQFLMNDHSDTNQYLDLKLGVKDEDDSSLDAAMEKRPRRVITRARESSFSLNSDEEFFYSSPEDEEDFLSQEFLKDYASIRADRLVTMSKAELIGEYVQMEERIDSLEKRLARSRADGDDPTLRVPKEVSDRIRAFQRQIHALEAENTDLRRENRELKRPDSTEHEEDVNSVTSSSASDDSCSSSSDDDSSSSSSDSSSSSEDEDGDNDEPIDNNNADEQQFADVEPEAAAGHVAAAILAPPPPPENLDETAQDTGYESGQSGEQQRRAIPAAEETEASNADGVVTSTS